MSAIAHPVELPREELHYSGKARRNLLMHLAYLDDSADGKGSKVAMIGALLIPDDRFHLLEASAGLVVERLIPEEHLEDFEEFHASDLYGGHGVFAEIEEPLRMQAIRDLIEPLGALNLPFVYSAVDKQELAKTAVGAVPAIDVAFRMCVRGIDQHLADGEDSLCLLIMDDTKNGELKKQLRSSFRTMRKPERPPWKGQMLGHIHDDMYFGDSKDSVGIQLADLCAYFVCRKIKGLADAHNFYNYISKSAICSKVIPEWNQLRGVFLEAQ